MTELIKWLKENVGESITILTPQFERPTRREYEWIPTNDTEFLAVVKSAPWPILKGLGFAKWDTMSNLIKENQASAKAKHEFTIPTFEMGEDGIQQAPTDMVFKPKHGPTEPITVDMDVILFPGEWYNAIPDGFLVTGLYGEEYPFKRGDSDDDIRFGCLPYGIKKEATHETH